jgi:glucose-6-phosphate 1-dehydrogenase
MVGRLVVLGGLGDLSMRHLLPGLAKLRAAGVLSAPLHVVAVDRQRMSTEQFRQQAGHALDVYASAAPASDRAGTLQDSTYLCADLSSAPDLSPALHGGPAIVYLALPPTVVEAAVRSLAITGLAPDSTVVVEKPFGLDLSSARRLSVLLRDVVDDGDVFRVDHFLYHRLVQTILATRRTPGPMQALWNREHVDRVEVAWEERAGVVGRAALYDNLGALRDMVQSHLLQVLAVVAMEPPIQLDARSFPAGKAAVLRRIPTLSTTEVAVRTTRARYTDGLVDGRRTSGYADEPGVDPSRQTETYAHVELRVATPCWRGVPFVIRTGRAVGNPRRHVVLKLRGGQKVAGRSEIRFGEDGMAGAPESMELARPARQLPPSALLIRDVLAGDRTFSLSTEEIEQCWRITDSIRAGWESDRTRLQDYPAGSSCSGAPGVA